MQSKCDFWCCVPRSVILHPSHFSNISLFYSFYINSVVTNLIAQLTLTGGTSSLDAPTLDLRTAVLSSLIRILKANPELKKEFERGGGFTWVMAVLVGLGRMWGKSQGSLVVTIIVKDSFWIFVVVLFDIFGFLPLLSFVVVAWLLLVFDRHHSLTTQPPPITLSGFAVVNRVY